MQSFVLGPACREGAHFCVGIAGPHKQSGALSASEEASSPARYHALRIHFDPPVSLPPNGGTRVGVAPSIRRLNVAPERFRRLRRRAHDVIASVLFAPLFGAPEDSSRAEKRNTPPSVHIRSMAPKSLRCHRNWRWGRRYLAILNTARRQSSSYADGPGFGAARDILDRCMPSAPTLNRRLESRCHGTDRATSRCVSRCKLLRMREIHAYVLWASAGVRPDTQMNGHIVPWGFAASAPPRVMEPALFRPSRNIFLAISSIAIAAQARGARRGDRSGARPPPFQFRLSVGQPPRAKKNANSKQAETLAASETNEAMNAPR